jgi:hypothetical protein
MRTVGPEFWHWPRARRSELLLSAFAACELGAKLRLQASARLACVKIPSVALIPLPLMEKPETLPRGPSGSSVSNNHVWLSQTMQNALF